MASGANPSVLITCLLICLPGALGCAQDAVTSREYSEDELTPSSAAGSRLTREVDARIRYYSDKTARYPRSWPVYVQLASAYLEKVRLTYDAAWLRQSLSAVESSLAIQPNLEAFKMKARAFNYGHRFEQAIEWGRRAQQASPGPDSEVIALLVEAYVGLGRSNDARKLLPPSGSAVRDFRMAGALGRWLASEKRWEEAVATFSQAARLARAARAREFVVWAEVSVAGILIDSGRLEEARSHLEAARRLDPYDVELLIHSAELLGAEGRAQEALASYRELATELANPPIHHMAFRAARGLEREVEAFRHFRAAEEGYLAVLKEREVYSLDALARLYADAEIHMDRALEFAERNLQYKRDADARSTLAYVRERMTP